MSSSTNTSALPSEAEAAAAKETGRLLASHTRDSHRVHLQVMDHRSKKSIRLPPTAVRLLARILEEMARGNAVRLVPVQAELTTQEAADMLNISRPTLIRLLNEGKIGHRLVGTHRRVRFESLIQFKRKADAARRAALAELAAYDQELGI